MMPATIAVAAGRPAREQGSPVNPPVVLSSTYVSQGSTGDGLSYTRLGTETWAAFEDALGALERAQLPAIVYGSGLAATAAALSLMPPGGTLVVPRHAYQGGLTLIGSLAAKHSWTVRRVDVADTGAVCEALWGADLALLESPTNPMLEVANLPEILSFAKAHGVRTVVDNTFATPLGQQPLALGADVVLHSVTKFLAGHSDVVLGALATNDPELDAELRNYRSFHGAIAGPLEVYLALRGLRTLALRLERAQANAAELARRLTRHPSVVEVRHPSLPDDLGHARAAAQLNGFGAILSVRTVGGAAGADAVVAACDLWVPATSLGGVESSLERRRRWPGESKTVPEDLLRLSVGIEDVEDLWKDLDRALGAAAA